jgi:hypothetical protein
MNSSYELDILSSTNRLEYTIVYNRYTILLGDDNQTGNKTVVRACDPSLLSVHRLNRTVKDCS